MSAWMSQGVLLTSGALPAGTVCGPLRGGTPAPFKRALSMGPEAGAQAPREGLCSFPCCLSLSAPAGDPLPPQPPAGLCCCYRGERGPRGCSALPPGRCRGVSARAAQGPPHPECVEPSGPGLLGSGARMTCSRGGVA